MHDPQSFRDLITVALERLCVERPLFHSEADFQHELAMKLREIDPSIGIRLERPVELAGGRRRINVDILIVCESGNYVIELKYVTVPLRYDEFLLTAQSAQDQRRYDILKDVARVEYLIESGFASGGCSLTLTNDPSLWETQARADTADAAFKLFEGRQLAGELEWGERAGAETKRGRELAINLSNHYTVNWKIYSDVPAVKNGSFRSLALFPTARPFSAAAFLPTPTSKFKGGQIQIGTQSSSETGNDNRIP